MNASVHELPTKGDDEKRTLPSFEGIEVRRVAITVPNVGGGLRDAMKVEPVAHEYGEEVLIVVRARVRKVNHGPLDKDTTDILERQEVYDAIDVAIVEDAEDGNYIGDVLDRIVEGVQYRVSKLDNEGTLLDPENGGEAAARAAEELNGTDVDGLDDDDEYESEDPDEIEASKARLREGGIVTD